MLRNILVPLDGSTFGEHAIPLALSLARRAQARVHLSLVHRPLEATYAEIQLLDDTLDEHLGAQERRYLTQVAARIKEASNIDVEVHLGSGLVPEVLRQQGKEIGVDLYVMTTHARGALGRWFLGSNTDEMVSASPAPLFLVHPADHDPDFQADVNLQHFLIPLDGTPYAERALDAALPVAGLWKADFTLLRVVSPVAPMPVPLGMGTFEVVAADMAERVEKLEKKIEEDAFKYLEGVAYTLRQRGLTVHTLVAMDDEPSAGVLHQAKSGIDAVALGSHGRTGFTRFFHGSVSDRVIRGSTLPVLVYHPLS